MSDLDFLNRIQVCIMLDYNCLYDADLLFALGT